MGVCFRKVSKNKDDQQKNRNNIQTQQKIQRHENAQKNVRFIREQIQSAKYFMEKFPQGQFLKGRKPTKKDKIKKENNQQKIQIKQQYSHHHAKPLEDNRKQIKDFSRYPYCAIGYIVSSFGANHKHFGTGCLVGPNLVLTVAHNLKLPNDHKEDNQSQEIFSYQNIDIYFYLGVNGNISEAAKQIRVKAMYFPWQFYNSPHKEEIQQSNYVILELDSIENLADEFGYFGIDTFWKNIDQTVYIVGYSKDRIRQIQIQNKINGQCAYLFQASGKISEITQNNKILSYYFYTSGGQSGSPIFIQNKGKDYQIVGIHCGVKKESQSMNFGLKMTQQVRSNINSIFESSNYEIKQSKQQIKKDNQTSQNISHNKKINYNQEVNLSKDIKQPQQQTLNNLRSYQQYIIIGNQSCQKGNYQQAIKNYQIYIKQNPQFPSVFNNLGLAYFQLGRLEQSIIYYKTAIQINPNYDMAYYNLGLTYDYLKRYQQAIKYYEIAIKINPIDHQSYYNLGLTHFFIDRLDEALEYFKKALKISPNTKIYQDIIKSLTEILKQRND